MIFYWNLFISGKESLIDLKATNEQPVEALCIMEAHETNETGKIVQKYLAKIICTNKSLSKKYFFNLNYKAYHTAFRAVWSALVFIKIG